MNGLGANGWSNYVRADTPAAPPDQSPSNLEARLSGQSVDLSWDAPIEDADTVTGCRRLRGEGDGDLETLVDDTQSTGTPTLTRPSRET